MGPLISPRDGVEVVDVAQLVEHLTVAQAVAGSIPVIHPIFVAHTVFPHFAPDHEARARTMLSDPVAQLDRAPDF